MRARIPFISTALFRIPHPLQIQQYGCMRVALKRRLPLSDTNGSYLNSIVENGANSQDAFIPAESKKQRRAHKSWVGPYAYHEELVLSVASLTNLGKGICRTENGWVVMVPRVIPGERVRLRIWRNHSNYSEADLIEVLEPSVDRVQPRCRYYGDCDGCQYQHMTSTAQRDWKRQHVIDVLHKLAGFQDTDAIKPVRGSDEVYAYRSKLTPHYDRPRKGVVQEIGFQRPGTRAIQDVEQCVIATPDINARLKLLRSEVRESVQAAYESDPGRRLKGATLFLRQSNEGVVVDPRQEVSETVNDLTFHYSAGTFWQNNPYVLPQLVSFVVQQAKAGGQKYLVDAYCGSGLFCLSGSKFFEKCFGVEISDLAVLSARRNAELCGITNAEFHTGDAMDIFASLKHLKSHETTVILDPPRRGCNENFLEQLFKFRPGRCVYVSCDPATQARDAKAFLAHSYSIMDVQPWDLFPQTRHCECVIVFSRSKDGPGA